MTEILYMIMNIHFFIKKYVKKNGISYINRACFVEH